MYFFAGEGVTDASGVGATPVGPVLTAASGVWSGGRIIAHLIEASQGDRVREHAYKGAWHVGYERGQAVQELEDTEATIQQLRRDINTARKVQLQNLKVHDAMLIRLSRQATEAEVDWLKGRCWCHYDTCEAAGWSPHTCFRYAAALINSAYRKAFGMPNVGD